MLSKSKILIESKCVVDGKEIAGFRAMFNTDAPEEMSLLPYQIDKAVCKEYRAVVREDQAVFEDYAYSIQEMMTATKSGGSTEAEETNGGNE